MPVITAAIFKHRVSLPPLYSTLLPCRSMFLGVQLETVAHLFFHGHSKALHQFQFLTTAPLLDGYFGLPDMFLNPAVYTQQFSPIQINSFQLQAPTEMFICNQTSVHCLPLCTCTI